MVPIKMSTDNICKFFKVVGISVLIFLINKLKEY